ncbi:tail fiber protein [uncultured Gilliamella sp.]|uniref:tail fiber protein n=1 Tax=uncultured Gilliamella sp. TaxID=1193505 RepID=UPI0025FF151B|nr:tail fiber protein [uncultured Gilliamella sp.]
MIIQKKPDYLIFADSAKKGENIEFPDVSRGWGVTVDQTASKPPMEWMNGAFNRIDKNMLYLLQQGVPEWSEQVTYPANAIIKYNGILYTAIVENDNARPSTNTTKWKKTQEEIPNASITTKGLVKLNSETNSDSETEAATPKAVKTVFDLTNNRINDITDKFQSDGFESRVYSHDKRFYLIVRDDGLVGMYNRVQERLPWGFTDNGVLVEGYVPANRILDLDKFVRGSIPVGIPLPWPQSTPPAGWFECNGASFDVNCFPELAKAYPWGSLPDLRGEFIRGWDNGRGVDPGRAILGWQNHQLAAHKHVMAWGENRSQFSKTYMDRSAPFGSTGISGIWHGAGFNCDFDNALYYTNDGTNGSISHNQVFTEWNDLNPTDRVGYETRPINVAFMYIVKAE